MGRKAGQPETVSQRVKLLRDAIGDHADDPRYVELVRGRGYRLLPRVEAVEPADPRTRRKQSLWFAAAAIPVVAAVLLIRAHVIPEAASPPSPSLAVLPFANMSPGQDHEYLADGMAEEILNLKFLRRFPHCLSVTPVGTRRQDRFGCVFKVMM